MDPSSRGTRPHKGGATSQTQQEPGPAQAQRAANTELQAAQGQERDPDQGQQQTPQPGTPKGRATAEQGPPNQDPHPILWSCGAKETQQAAAGSHGAATTTAASAELSSLAGGRLHQHKQLSQHLHCITAAPRPGWSRSIIPSAFNTRSGTRLSPDENLSPAAADEWDLSYPRRKTATKACAWPKGTGAALPSAVVALTPRPHPHKEPGGSLHPTTLRGHGEANRGYKRRQGGSPISHGSASLARGGPAWSGCASAAPRCHHQPGCLETSLGDLRLSPSLCQGRRAHPAPFLPHNKSSGSRSPASCRAPTERWSGQSGPARPQPGQRSCSAPGRRREDRAALPAPHGDAASSPSSTSGRAGEDAGDG